MNEDCQEIVKKCIAKIVEINKNAKPNTNWEQIKGTVRNETLPYATFKKKETNRQEKILINEITLLQKKIQILPKYIEKLMIFYKNSLKNN